MSSATASKPSRSDELTDLDEQLRLAQIVREKFDEQAPKRPHKPSRSELVDTPLTDPPSVADIPEFSKFQSLSSHSEPLMKDIAGEPAEEFVETEYYTDLNSVDKSLHHTTGTGFIQVEKNGVVDLQLPSGGLLRTKSASNPATNDWIPSLESVFPPSSDKPGRSDP